MKAQILKIAGVKNEKEFYKKFPTEEAFMAKHGAKLRKAQVGDMIGGEQAPMYKPISYNNLASNAQASVYGISPEEQARQEALASQQAIANASGQKGGGIADILGGIDPKMIMSLAGGAKNGKMLHKFAGGGFVPSDIPSDALDPQMPSDYQAGNLNNIGQNAFGGIGKFINSDIGGTMSSSKKGFDWKNLAGQVVPQLGTLIGAFKDIEGNNKDIAKANMYGKVSDLTLQAASSRPEKTKRRYVRPEDQLTQNFKPLGSGTNYLAAANGTMIGGNPTEIQNMYTTPDTMYTDLEYEPLTDDNKVKNFKKGGKINKAAGGVNLDPFASIGGSLGGALGSATGKGTGKGGPGSTIGSALGGIAGSFIPIPGVGTFLGSTLGGFVGGLFDSQGQNEAQAAQDKLNQNLQASAFQSGTQNLQTQNKAFMEDGGWVSNDWMPQVITTFGDHKVSDLLKPPHDADMLRAGGHMSYYTPPSAEAMYTGKAENGVQMAMGGDLQVGRGSADTMSYNPYLPGDGETVMFRGPSHDNGGMPISFGNNGVEVEGGEPAIKMEDGGKKENLVVYGNMMIPDYGVNEIGDPKAKGKKFKHYIADLSKQEAKINKSVDKGVKLVNTKDSDDPYDQLAFNSGKAMMMGGDLKLKTIAERKLDAAAVQNAILDTADEYGVKSDDLAKGKIKMDKDNNMYAEFGKKVMFDKGGKAGKKYDPEFENFINQAMQLEQANSYQAGNYRGGGSNFGTNNKSIQTPEQAKEYYYKNYWSKVKDLPAGLRTRALQMAINTGDPYGELMVASGKMSVKDRAATTGERKDKAITGNKNWEASKADILKAYKENPEEFLAKLDSEQNRYYDSLVAHNDFGINKDTNREFYDDYMGLAKYASQQYIPREKVAEAIQTAQPVQQAIAPVAQQPVAPVIQQATAPAASAQPEIVPITPKASTTVKQIGTLDEEPIIIENKNVKNKKPQYDMPKTSLRSIQPTSFDTRGAIMNAMDKSIASGAYKASPSSEVSEEDKGSQKPVKNKTGMDNDWMNLLGIGLSSALGQLRPSNAEFLDPAQLAPEMMSLATNQLEPVQAQTFQPLLSAPTSYSLQDQLNEITSQTRAAEKMSAYNPEAASMIAAQAYNAKNKVLGEQFRMNQAEQQRVAEQNRNVLNDANLKNLAILDTQYQRQEQAKSATKQQAIEAMKSIADKTAKNKLENRQLGVMENLYNYRFNKSGQAYNLNGLQFFNMNGALAKNQEAAPEGWEWEKTLKKKKDSDTGRNGAIVKAIKNL
jgi:hypothetical protein